MASNPKKIGKCITIAGNPPASVQDAAQYRGAVNIKSFIGWVVVVVAGAASVGLLTAQLLVNKRQSELITETAARVDIQGENKSKLVGEWLNGQIKVADTVAGAQLLRLMVADAIAPSNVSDTALREAVEAQKPYMQQVLTDLLTRNKFEGVHVLKTDGSSILSAGTMPAIGGPQLTLLQAVQRTGEGRLLPIRQGQSGLVIDVLRPIKTVADTPVDSPDEITNAILWGTLPAGAALTQLMSPLPSDRAGERTLILQQTGGNVAILSQGTIATAPRTLADVEAEYNNGRALSLSLTDGTATFGKLTPVADSPFYVLQEYTAREALALMELYKPGLYTIVTLATMVLGALMLALTLHLMAQRNRTRVKLMGQTMEALVRAVEARDTHLAGHHARVSRLVVQVGNNMNIPVGERATLFYAAQLSAVGRLMVPRDILAKTSKLNAAERKELEGHLAKAMDVLRDLDFDLPIIPVISEMYEREDGTGHPRGLKGPQISRMGKILAVADAYVALTSTRAHRDALKPAAALEVLDKGQFNAVVVSTLRTLTK